ncbi:phosphoserine phosphatase [Skermanella stibiiresistens SB22]|uniref:Phosphoserine phosphatase n=1 Tax=Skermanella stibiiresistens SB22 TaxID=1385369 RepID=W9H9P1_9PROT|nr:phosphoserine phosphatase SerB [Skermanella stibiiresistens]EWY41471.1 phosphoserine phosphatase [Skermanella stibiiresistens SB22]
MINVLTLIADPAAADLDDSTVAAARAALSALGAETGAPDWLAPGIACDVPFDGLNCDQADAALHAALPTRPVDMITQPVEGRRKRLLVADMESTIIRQEMLDELAEMVGLKDLIAGITYRAMNGEIDFKDALRERVALLKDLPVDALERAHRRVELMPGAVELVATMKANGAYCALVSGGFKFFTERVRVLVGFDEDQANDLEIVDGKLSGNAIEPILDKDAKVAALIRVAGANRIPLRESMTVGDGANDLPMLQAAGLGVAFHAKPVVASQARARVERSDLTALLYAQGYRADEIRKA